MLERHLLKKIIIVSLINLQQSVPFHLYFILTKLNHEIN